MVAAGTYGSYTRTLISIARQRFAVRVPMRPKPTIRMVFSARSTGISFQRSCQRSSRTAASWNITFLASAYIMKIACSATETEFAVPTTISGMPRAVSAGMSTAS